MGKVAGPVICTVGHSNRTAAALIGLLQEAGIGELWDVRARPASRAHPQFNRTALRAELAAAGIAYAWWGEALGGLRQVDPNSRHVALAPGYRGFADHMATAAFRQAAATLVERSASTRIALMCAERSAADCHRRLIADHLLARGIAVTHLVEPGLQTSHTLSPEARAELGELVYDAGTLRLDF